MKATLVAGLLATLCAGCGSGGDSGCTAGETQKCYCVGGGEGVQVCAESGNAWGSCEGCSPADIVPLDGGEELPTPPGDLVPGTDTAADGQECVPQCDGKDCGEDGCGGFCGTCGSGWTCDAGTCQCPNMVCGDACCAAAELCVEGACCLPACDGKECGSDGCGGSCGTCEGELVCQDGKCGCEFVECAGQCCSDGQACFEDACCDPQCEGKECGDDGCGGLCNGCLDILYDDGKTETAYGYSSEPDPKPDRIACVVKFELPQANMVLASFTAGWMWGLYNLQIPFDLGYLKGSDMECEEVPDGAWYKAWCKFAPDKVVSIGSKLLPVEPYKPMGKDLIGEVTLPEKTIYMVTLFDIDKYPIYVCPIDTSANGGGSFMMSQHADGPATIIDGPSFDQKDKNVGVIPFRIRVELPQ